MGRFFSLRKAMTETEENQDIYGELGKQFQAYLFILFTTRLF